jgi:zinc/manganese transport system substrate-binding protein
VIIRTVNTSTGRRRVVPAVLAGALTVALAACSGGSSGSGAGSTAAGADRIAVLASTNVWGDVVEQVGGDHVQVTSVISEPSADPHSYQSTARDQLALSKAALIVENGGGYDDFMQTMIASAGTAAPVISAVEVSGLAGDDHGSDGGPATGSAHADDGHDHGEFNEHVWYDLPTAGKVADAVAQQLATIDPANAGTFQANAAAFQASLAPLTDEVGRIRAAHDGAPAAVTEPVPLNLLEAAGLDNVTPEQFSEAIENETDVPAAVMDQTLKLFTGKQVKVLVYNEQTTGPQTEQVVEAAKANGIPAVPVTETLPDGQDYLSWMQANIQALGQALGG